MIVSLISRGQRGSCENLSHFIWASVFEFFETTIALWLGRPAPRWRLIEQMPHRAQTLRKGDVVEALKAALRRDLAAASRRRTMRDDLIAELSLRKRAEAAG